jgi:hypothetical protein
LRQQPSVLALNLGLGAFLWRKLNPHILTPVAYFVQIIVIQEPSRKSVGRLASSFAMITEATDAARVYLRQVELPSARRTIASSMKTDAMWTGQRPRQRFERYSEGRALAKVFVSLEDKNMRHFASLSWSQRSVNRPHNPVCERGENSALERNEKLSIQTRYACSGGRPFPGGRSRSSNRFTVIQRCFEIHSSALRRVV